MEIVETLSVIVFYENNYALKEGQKDNCDSLALKFNSHMCLRVESKSIY